MKTLPEPIEQLNPPSDYLEEVLTTPPHWAARWGILGLFFLIISLLLFSWLIRYPDRIEGKIILTTPAPPIAIVAQHEGYLANLEVINRDTVPSGTVLGIIQNSTHHPDIERLQHLLDNWQGNQNVWLDDSLALPRLQLGSLQQYYSRLREAHDTYYQHTYLSLYAQEQQLLMEQQAQYQILLSRKQTEKELAEQVAQLAEKDFTRNQELFQTQAIAEKALEESEQYLLETKQAAQALSSEVSQFQLSLQKLKREILQLEKQYRKEEASLQSDWQGALANLKAALRQWKRQYILHAPISGYVSYTGIQNNQGYLQKGDTILYILPDAEQPITGQLRVPVSDFGKVRKGQTVRVYLEQYPHQEYGRLQGEVVDWSVVPNHAYYQVTVQFSSELTTQYGKNIHFQQHLSGRAEIVTQPRKLLERIISLLRKLPY